MACIFPGAPDLETFHKNLISGHDAISNVPANRWDPLYFDPNSNSPDRLYCRRGGFIDEYAEFAPVEFGFMPAAVAGSEPDQLLCLQVAARALVDAGIQTGRQPLERTGVILGRGGYPTTGMTRLINGIRTAEELIIVLRAALPNLPDSQLAKLKQEFQTKAQVGRSSDMVGLVPNLAASLITNRLNLNGPAYTVDAACASALVAIDQACQELSTKRCDLIIAGGVHLTHDVTFWSVFCELGVMSRSQEIRPFDRRADGLLLGEGVGLLVLKRWTEAKQDGNRIYAVIHGSGVASDGRESSLVQPNSDGQLKALQRAWLGCEQQPDQIGLIEAHGTGTSVGDLVEIETLGRFFGKRNSSKRAGLGSVKSMIGHCMPAAGAAGMIKTALAIHHGFLPPTLNCEQPHPQLAETRFQLIHQTHNWESEQRLAGVTPLDLVV
jgi:acyl transferase domain-containing protein